jgi:uncharacterized protein with beta-barrel porin domain
MKRVLLGSSALLCLGLVAPPAFAACTTTSPMTGQTVDCTGASSTEVFAGAGQTNITVNAQDGSNLTVPAGSSIALRDNSTINLLGNAVVSTSGVNSPNLVIFGNNGTVTLNGTSQARTTGSGASTSIGMLGNGGRVVLNDNSMVSTVGNGAFGVAVMGSSNNSIVMNGNSMVDTTGTDAYGLTVSGTHGLISLNDAASVSTTNANGRGALLMGDTGSLQLTGASNILTAGATAQGIFVSGNSDTVSLAGTSFIQTTGAGSVGIYGLGNSQTVTLSGSSQVWTNGLNATGISLTGNQNQIVLTGGGNVETHGNAADALSMTGAHDTIVLTGGKKIITLGQQSIGAYIHGDYGAITFDNNTAYSTTNGDQSHAAYIKGNKGAITLNGMSVVETVGNNAYGAKMFGDNGAMTLNNQARIVTGGASSAGALAIGSHDSITLNGQSTITTGGVGAHGAYVFGSYDTISLNDSSRITTSGLTTSATGAHGNSNQITLNGAASIVTSGSGAGINLNGNNNGAYLYGQSSIRASGIGGYGILLQGNQNFLSIDTAASVIATGAATPAVVVTGGSATIMNGGIIQSATGTAILGDNNAANSDNVINTGRIIGGGGTAINLQDGNDSLTLSTGSQLTGAADGGVGNDTLTLLGTGGEDDVFINFETLAMNGQNWSLSGTSSFGTIIAINKGRLAINGTITAPSTTVAVTGVLGGNGTLVSNVTSVGTIAPGNSVGTLTINGNFSQGGGAFDVEVDKTGVDRLNVLGAGGATLASNPTLNVINYGGAAGGSGIILHAPSGITGSFGTVTYQGNGAATVTQTATDISLITVDGTPLVGSAFAASETGLDYLDAVNDEQLAGLRNCGTDSCDRNADQRFHLWAKGFGRFSNEAAEAGNQSFDYRIAGTAVGGDMAVADGLRLGVSFGYSNTEEDVAQHAASSDIDTTQASLYANYQHGPYFVTGQLSGGWQHVDQSRAVGTAGGAAEADSTTHGWLFGSSLQAGAHFGFPQGWWLTPSAGVSYQHQWVNGTTEHGGGASDVAIADHQADALRLKAQLVLSQDYQLTGYTITPHLKLGVQQQFNLGGTADGSFSDGSDFSLALIDNNRTMGLAGVGVQVAFDNGLSTYVDYDGALASGRTVQSITGGLRYAW